MHTYMHSYTYGCTQKIEIDLMCVRTNGDGEGDDNAMLALY